MSRGDQVSFVLELVFTAAVMAWTYHQALAHTCDFCARWERLAARPSHSSWHHRSDGKRTKFRDAHRQAILDVSLRRAAIQRIESGDLSLWLRLSSTPKVHSVTTSPGLPWARR